MSPYQRARTDDPHTSHLAADEVERTGRAEIQKSKIYESLRRHKKPITSMELACYTFPLNRYQVARRLPELEEDGLVIRCEARKCTCSKRQAITWLADA